MKVTVDITKTNTNGSTIINKVNDLDERIDEIKQHIEDVKKIWSGPKASKFINDMDQTIIPKLEELSNNLRIYGSHLQVVSSAYEILDGDYANSNPASYQN